MSGTAYTRDVYTVGIICALAVEKAAVAAMLDSERPPPLNVSDENDYTFGTIGGHSVVIACLPAGMLGVVSAAVVARDLMHSFPIRIGLMVGIGGGVWSEADDVRLGDVVVSQPDGQHGGVVQWDFGKTEAGGKFRRIGTLNKPPRPLLTALQGLRAKHLQRGHKLESHLTGMVTKYPLMAETFVHQGEDVLYAADYEHQGGDTCKSCDASREVERDVRRHHRPHIHYGNIASGNAVMKHGPTRDRLAQEEGVICFEMEAAGLMDSFPCIVIRGICDYADSHKNKRWQPYAAAVAAAYARELLLHMPATEVAQLKTAKEAEALSEYATAFSLQGMPATDHFAPRDSDMRCLTDFFTPLSGQPQRQRVFVVHGMGGIGKTQLCAEFVKTHADRFTAVFWLEGSSKDALQRAIADAAVRRPRRTREAAAPAELTDLREDFLNWLSLPDNTKWLIVIDNVDREWQAEINDEQAYDYSTFLPHGNHGNVLITTRLRRLQRPNASLQLGIADNSLARAIFENHAGRAVEGIDKLLPKLNGLPLALAQAGAYIGVTGMSVSDYIEHYDDTWDELMKNQNQYPLQEYAERSVLTTWKMSYQQVQKVNVLAARLLDLWAYLDHNDIWVELILAGRSDAAQRSDSLSQATKLSTHHSIGVLAQYSMVNPATASQRSSIHTVVHTWCLYNIEDIVVRQRLLAAALVLVARMVRSAGEVVPKEIGLRLAAHAKAVGARLPMLPVSETTSGSACYDIANFLSDWEQSSEIETLYMRALREFGKTLGAEHLSTLNTINNLGTFYFDQGKMAEAEEMYVRALRGNEKARGAEHASTIETVNNLGCLYFDQGRMAEAEEMYERALRGNEKMLGAEHKSTLDTVNNLGLLYAGQGKMEKAEEMYLRALRGYEEVLGTEHTSTLDTVHNLGIFYEEQGKMTEAEEMYLRALRGNEKALGAEHTSTLVTANCLSTFYLEQDNLVKAEEMFLWVLRGKEKIDGTEHESTLDTVYNLGLLYQKQGKMVQAQEMLTRALRGYEKLTWFPQSELDEMKMSLLSLYE